MRSSRVRAAWAAALFLGVLSFYPAYAQSQSHAGLQLLSGVGYHTNGRTPSVLIGLEYVANVAGRQHFFRDGREADRALRLRRPLF